MKLADEKIVAALLANTTNAQATEELGITESYLYKRMRDDEFRRKYRFGLNYMFHTCLETAQRALSESLYTMLDIMRDETNAPQTRLNAAIAIRDSATKLQAAAEAEREHALCEELYSANQWSP